MNACTCCCVCVCGFAPFTRDVFLVPENHVSVVRLLLVAGASLELETLSRLRALDKAAYSNASWELISDAALGEIPEEVVCLVLSKTVQVTVSYSGAFLHPKNPA